MKFSGVGGPTIRVFFAEVFFFFGYHAKTACSQISKSASRNINEDFRPIVGRANFTCMCKCNSVYSVYFSYGENTVLGNFTYEYAT